MKIEVDVGCDWLDESIRLELIESYGYIVQDKEDYDAEWQLYAHAFKLVIRHYSTETEYREFLESVENIPRDKCSGCVTKCDDC
jgi:hypothetical protein